VTLLSLQDVRAGYGNSEVLHGIDLDVSAGGTTALLGANGAGKTTTLRAISGLVARRGRINFDGRDISGMSTDAVAKLGIAHVPQGRGTLTHLSVRENLLVGALRRRDRAAVRRDLDRCLQLFPFLGTRSRTAAGNLSGGEQQMLAISRALMSRPKLLLLDEPSLGLAPVITRQVFDTLVELRGEWQVSVLVVEQNAALALRIADRAAVLEFGSVVMTGPAAEIAGHDAVRRAYLGS
jgi:branched-chain amino acid transport system ATP-binding protein